ncbi:MAG: beta-glucuronidase [Planctomycetes bacterium]|nr:beta-glucuronidase [Planctomycetota bacterium]
MLYPVVSKSRSIVDLSGFWEYKADRDDSGEKSGFGKGFAADGFIGVPGSWNEQLAESGLMNYNGVVWYKRKFFQHECAAGKRFILRFGSADFEAKVWVNGEYVGGHIGGWMAFEFDVTDVIREGENVLVVSVDSRLNHETIPQGISEADFAEFGKQRFQSFPATVFDFFTFGGLHRLVQILSVSDKRLMDVAVETKIEGTAGIVKFAAKYSEGASGKVKATLLDGDKEIGNTEGQVKAGEFTGQLRIEDCRIWGVWKPELYTLRFELCDGETVVDEYSLDVGVREIELKGDKLLLNGEPVFLKGFGMHEDFAVIGKAVSYPLIVKDFQMLKWIGANSFRTSHYPYSEEIMHMADRCGVLVIDEVPAVSLNFHYVNEKTLENHKRALTELVARDKNHPCVIAWSIANEPGIWKEEEAVSEAAHKYWKEIYGHTKNLDAGRPITLPTCAVWKEEDLGYMYVDFISVNRYWGWYDLPGEAERAGAVFKAELEGIYKRYKKPIMVTEFGADTIEGLHSTTPQIFTEEYQVDLIQAYFDAIGALPYMLGEHIWNFADFRTAQHHRRVVLNKKGVFNRSREPKAVAFSVKKHWAGE